MPHLNVRRPNKKTDNSSDCIVSNFTINLFCNDSSLKGYVCSRLTTTKKRCLQF